MLDVELRHLDLGREILQRHLPSVDVWAFGSRAAGKARRFSDLDLARVGQDKIPLREMARLREAFEESALPFRVDLVDWQQISPEFHEVIKRRYEIVHSIAHPK